jgi:hypothetical protein
MHTVNALPYVMNYGQSLAAHATKDGVRVGRTGHLQALHERGYRLTVLESDFAEFCDGNPVAECLTYNSGSPTPTLATPMTVGERTGLIGLKFLSLSRVAVEANDLANRVIEGLGPYGVPRSKFEIFNYARSSTVAALVAFDELTRRLRSARPGEAYFAHLLLPHYPHVVRSDCSNLPWREWELRRAERKVEDRYRSYAPQVRCTLRKVDQALRAFAASPGGKRGIVIVQGDHGSRIFRVVPVTENLGRFGFEDLIAGHSTLFAIHAPGIPAQSFPQPQSTAPLLRDFVAADLRAAPLPAASRDTGVMLGDSNWHPRKRVRMPPGW